MRSSRWNSRMPAGSTISDAHRDDDAAADQLEAAPVLEELAAEDADAGACQREDDREPGDEAGGRPDDARPPVLQLAARGRR